MKYVRKTLALLLALSLLLCAAFAETAEGTDESAGTAAEAVAETAETAAPAAPAGNPVLAAVNGVPIYKSECDDLISRAAQQGTATWTSMFPIICPRIRRKPGPICGSRRRKACMPAASAWTACWRTRR